jgi:predicted RecA/RadA family phage recombinase
MADNFIFRHGKPTMTPYTPSAGDIAAGDGVLIGNLSGWTMGIAHHDIANGVLGELSCGGGVYDCKVASNYAAGSKVHFDGTDTLTTTNTNNALFGFTLEASAAANDIVRVLHMPHVGVA